MPSYAKPSPETSSRMSKVRRCGTDIERTMAALLRGARLHYRSQPALSGNPDFRIATTRIVIFCDSAFWHGRWLNTPRAERFHKNQSYWHEKLEANRSKDRRINRKMRKRGWTVLRFWDEDIIRRPRRVIATIKDRIEHESSR